MKKSSRVTDSPLARRLKQWETLRQQPAPQADVQLRPQEENAVIRQRKRTGAWYDYNKPQTYPEHRKRERRRLYLFILAGLILMVVLVVINVLRLAGETP